MSQKNECGELVEPNDARSNGWCWYKTYGRVGKSGAGVSEVAVGSFLGI